MTETVNKAAGAMQRDQNGADIPDKPLFVRTLGIVDSYPVGCPIPYPGPVALYGYLLMDGRPFSKTLYPQLAKLYVDGVLPDMRGMYVRGWDDAGIIDVASPGSSHLNDLGLITYKKPVMESSISSVQKPYYDLGKAGPRGYKLLSSDFYTGDNIRLSEGKRALLSNQYYEYLMDDFTGSLRQFYEYDSGNGKITSRYMSPSYELDELKTIVGKSRREIIDQTKIKLIRGRFDSIQYTPNNWSGLIKDEITTSAPKSFKAHNLAPVGVPNVAFNYITKAA
ncbi:tail fiber protein [Salmonella enterica subsp. enterica serovar Infantis]|nr:tail fiber protein [Salmonella enterica subsp. enterica serovar Infantis]